MSHLHPARRSGPTILIRKRNALENISRIASRCQLSIDSLLTFLYLPTHVVKFFFGTIFLDELENFPLFLFDMVVDVLKEGLHFLIEVLVVRLQSRNLGEQLVDVFVLL